MQSFDSLPIFNNKCKINKYYLKSNDGYIGNGQSGQNDGYIGNGQSGQNDGYIGNGQSGHSIEIIWYNKNKLKTIKWIPYN